MQQDTAEN